MDYWRIVLVDVQFIQNLGHLPISHSTLMRVLSLPEPHVLAERAIQAC